MQVSLNWLRQYLDTQQSEEAIGDLLTNIGLEVEGTATYETIPGSLAGLVVGEVLTCVPHPNANKLSLTTVHVGAAEPLPIVCGAPNVAAGQKVVVATIGTMLYPAEGEPFKIKKGKIRGEVSMGMICAEDEIGLGNSHAGIMVLAEDAPVGQAAATYFADQVVTDTVYDIGLTPNRSDATGHLGVAFDLSAALRTQHPGEGALTRPDVSAFQVTAPTLQPTVEVVATEQCTRYTGVCLTGVTVKASPAWLQHRLKAIGLTPKNNVVDITNYVLHELGQPLHAFDYDKIGGEGIVVQNLPSKTAFTTLDGVERQLDATDLMICDAQGKGLCIAGVFGGIDSGVTEQTTRIFLESACFNATAVRRTSMRHLLRTDAATRFEKGVDPNGTLYALQRAALLLQELAGGTIASEVIDWYPQPVARAEVAVAYRKVSDLIGVALPKADIHNILGYLDMPIVAEDEATFTVAVPTNKVDVTRDADVIEEILRIYGYNQVPMSDTLRSALAFAPKPNPFKVRNLLAELLTSIGYNEMMALSITRSEYYTKHWPQPAESLVYINNTSNQHLDLMRPHMLYSGLEAIVHNQNRQQQNLRLYEFGKTYTHEVVGKDDARDYVERQHLTLFLTGQRQAENWHTAQQPVSFYTLKAHVEQVLQRIGLLPQQLQTTALKETDAPFVYGLRYHRGKQNIVTFGRLDGTLTQGMDIKQEVFYADFDVDVLLQILKKHKMSYKPVSKYPAVRRDLALVLDQQVNYSDILGIAIKTGGKQLRSTNLFDVYENAEHVGENKKSCSVSFLFQDDNKTLKDKDVDKIMNKLMAAYEQRLGALIRK